MTNKNMWKTSGCVFPLSASCEKLLDLMSVDDRYKWMFFLPNKNTSKAKENQPAAARPAPVPVPTPPQPGAPRSRWPQQRLALRTGGPKMGRFQ